LLPEMVMHLLQVLDGNRDLPTRLTIRRFATEDTHGNALVGVRCVGEPGNNIPWSQATFLAIDSSFVEITGNDEDTPRGIQRWRDIATAQSELPRICRISGLLFDCKLLPYFLCNGLLHLRRQLCGVGAAWDHCRIGISLLLVGQ